jgi:microcystin-dependent protein
MQNLLYLFGRLCKSSCIIYTALFSLLGTTYGGDGKSNFALPDLQGRAPMHPNFPASGGLSGHDLGETGGSERVTLLESEIPAHSHAMMAVEDDGQFFTPVNGFLAAGNSMYTTSNPNTTMSPQMLSPAGGDLPHNKLQPSAGDEEEELPLFSLGPSPGRSSVAH